METEKALSPQESLDLIANAISKTKENIRENSFSLLLWGWLMALASVGYFILHEYTSVKYFFAPFPILALLGIIVTVMMFKRRTCTTVTYTGDFLRKMWAVLGASFIMVVFINVSKGHDPFTYTLILAGIGTLVSGWVLKFWPLVIGGGLFLISAIATIYVGQEVKPLLHGAAFVAGYLVPGYLLKNSKA